MRHRRLLLPLLAALTLVSTPVAACAEEAGLGRVSFPNSGAPEAQEAFLSGLAALHSFFYDEAADLFREAQGIDPGFTLAYWGEAMTHNHPLWQQVDVGAARSVLERLAPTPAERAARAGTALEKDFLAAVEILYGEGDKAERDRAYSAHLERLHQRYPDNHEVTTFYALSLQGLSRWGAVDPRLQMRSAALLEEVFAANPLHPGAAHYLIHAYDDPVHAPLGLRPARVYAGIAPAAPHALHMPSHIFVQLGMWDAAAASNRSAYDASVAWQERRGHGVGHRDLHSLGWLHYVDLQRGRVAAAGETLEEMRRVAAATEEDRAHQGLSMMLARQTVEPWGGEVTLPAPSEGEDDGLIYARGLLAARRGDRAALAREAERLAARDAGGDGHYDRVRRVMARQLEALAALAAGKKMKTLALLIEADELEQTLGTPSGPPMPPRPAVELAGEVLLELGQPAKAAERFAASLERTPKRTASLLGAARAARALGDEATAAERYAELLAIWHSADSGLPVLAEARRYAGGEATQPAP